MSFIFCTFSEIFYILKLLYFLTLITLSFCSTATVHNCYCIIVSCTFTLVAAIEIIVLVIAMSLAVIEATIFMICFDKIIRKFVAKLLKYRIMFKDTLTCLGLDYRDALLIILYLTVIEISIK